MWGLMQRQLEYLGRERALREAGATLVTATSAASIHDAAASAMLGIAGEDACVRICEIDDQTGALVVVTALGGDAVTGPTGVTLDALEDWKRSRLSGGHGYRVAMSDSVLREPLSLPEDHVTAFVAPLLIRDALSGVLVVSVPESLPRHGRRRAGIPHLAGLTRARERRAHRRPADPAEPGAIRLARAELLGPRHADRARHHHHVREPVGGARARDHRGLAGGDAVRRPHPGR